jgi:hypothetical protein
VVFFQDVVGGLVGHGDDNRVVVLLASFLASGTDSFQVEDVEPPF